MSYFSINGLIAFFDLRNILCDPSQERHKLMYECELNHDIKISFFNNFYYFIDFSHCKLRYLAPILNCKTLDDFKQARDSIAINLQKEVINAINALIYIEQRKKQPNISFSTAIKRSLVCNDIDQFIIPNTVDKVFLPLEEYIHSEASFSSEAYKIACKAILRQEPHHPPCALEIAKQAVENFNFILSKKDCKYSIHPFYILSNLWKSIYFKNHDLRIDASIQLRSVFEALIKSKFNLNTNTKINLNQYEKYCESEEVNTFFKNAAEIRHSSVHALVVPDTIKDLDQYIQYLVNFFKRDFELDITEII